LKWLVTLTTVLRYRAACDLSLRFASVTIGAALSLSNVIIRPVSCNYKIVLYSTQGIQFTQ